VIALLTADAVNPRCLAASVKLRVSATFANTRTALRFSTALATIDEFDSKQFEL
jgi:hypothetical protein